MFKRVLCLAMAMAFLLAVPAMALQLDDCRVSYCDDYVTMRASASTSAKEVIKVPYGAMVRDVTCKGYNDAFYHCTYNGYSGYILSKYLLGGQEMADIEGAHVVHCKDWVSLRVRPKTSAQRLVKVPLGAYLDDCYYVENGFVHCWYAGKEGYIQADYVDYGY